MMVYQNVEDLKLEYNLNDALESIREFWYKLLEGIITVPRLPEKREQFIQYFQEELPEGWSLSIDDAGNVRFISAFKGKFSQLAIEKSWSGEENVKVVPYEINSPVIS